MCHHLPRVTHCLGEKMNQEKLAKLQAQVRIGGKVSRHNSVAYLYANIYRWNAHDGVFEGVWPLFLLYYYLSSSRI